MTNRVTGKQIEAYVKRLRDSGCPIAINSMGTGWRVTTKNEERDLSPRLSPREVMDWLRAFHGGWRMAMEFTAVYESGAVDQLRIIRDETVPSGEPGDAEGQLAIIRDRARLFLEGIEK